MRFIFFVIDQLNNPANSNEIDNIDKFNESLQIEGHWIMAAGIQQPSAAFLIDNRNNQKVVSAESLSNSPEFYSGFWIVEAETDEKAKELASAASLACNRKVEVRPFIQ